VNARIVLLPGDGIGPEVIDAAAAVLQRVAERFGHTFVFTEHLIGGSALADGRPSLPPETLNAAREAQAVLLGAVGDPEFDHLPPAQRPEAGLLALRRGLGVYANLRPARAWKGLEGASPLKPDVLRGTDMIVVRELAGGLYYGEPRGHSPDGSSAVNTLVYSRDEVTRIARVAFELARCRRKSLVSVDKANVLEVSRLWRDAVIEVGRDYSDVKLTHEYVDAAAMKLALTPAAFDVIRTENMFGDILSDEAGAICGSLGLLPSASLGPGPGLFEPVHGSAPTLADRNLANPIGAILSGAMLLADGLHLRSEAQTVVDAVERAIRAGHRTADLTQTGPSIGTSEMTAAILGEL